MSMTKIPFSFNLVLEFSYGVPQKVKDVALKEAKRVFPKLVTAANATLGKLVAKLPRLKSAYVEDTSKHDAD